MVRVIADVEVPELYSLVYVSAATRLTNEAELAELLKECQRKNQQLGITGMLLYRAGEFMQVLEGVEPTVKELYARICQDPRHRMVTRIVERPVEKRSFPDWTMGFRVVSDPDLRKDPGFTDFLEKRFIDVGVVKPNLALKLLLSFRQS